MIYPPPLPQNKIRELIKQSQTRDPDTTNIIVLHNMRLVCKLAKKWKIEGYTEQELIQEGAITLSKCIKRFDTNYGTQFSTYITKAITNHYKSLYYRKKKKEKGNKIKYMPNMTKIQQHIEEPEYSFDMIETLKQEFQLLNEREKDILLDRLDKIPLNITSKKFGVSRETIRNWEKIALKKLSKSLNGVDKPITIGSIR